MACFMRVVACFAFFSSVLLLPFVSELSAGDTIRVSIVDYLKAVDMDSSFENRTQLFGERFSGEEYKGTAEQNIKLLKELTNQSSKVLLPIPSASIEKCREFYGDENIAKYFTQEFMKNAMKACVVTGTETPQNAIREKLQQLYSSTKPQNGSIFTPEEHKAIHDQAYKAAGCKENSADLWGWYVVDKANLPEAVVKKSIDWFGKCTVNAD
ncbi:MAG: DUF3597 family protein [Planctomycetaceae bacterium]|nr:DUF3597 family protein [Planctomycetaceae bacterium]